MPSYGSDDDLVAYLAQTGRVLPDDAVPAQVRSMGTMYVDSFEDLFKGRPLTDENSFPRNLWPVVPTRVEWASYEAAWAVSQGIDIWGAGGSGSSQVVREKVDVLEVQYTEAQWSGIGDWWDRNRFIIPQVYALLLPYFKRPCGYGAFIV